MRIVLDTNIIISALIFNSGHVSWLRQTWIARQITPLVDKACIEELLRALAYPKFKLSPEEIESLLGQYLPQTITLNPIRKSRGKIPQCKDAHDQKFLELAYTGNVKYLVTGDKALLALQGKTPFEILTPAELKKRL